MTKDQKARQTRGEVFVPREQRTQMKLDRIAKGWTTRQAGTRAGVSQGTISNFERFKHETVSAAFYMAYFRALYGKDEHVSVDLAEVMRAAVSDMSRLDKQGVEFVRAVIATLLDAQRK